MDDELKNFIKVWIMVVVSLLLLPRSCTNPKGYDETPISPPRLLRLHHPPTVPLNLYSFHFSGPTALFLVWIGNFKLLLFAFDQGPLSPRPPPPKLSHFICIACLPIKVKRHPPLNTKNPSHLTAKFPQRSSPNAETPPKPTTNAATKTPRSTSTQTFSYHMVL
ncbi:putative long-chain-alcohol O-fatty-acyltransferase 3 [Morella rubra]|uniref:Putative long-chain-alcohol O-fatty-acyltransferase 3 n=1 Tax=Morella rubra TaxID=262757 RepID=A0A6A1WNT1_9ROSI|nr:putative long-chain-alcohol O-fatty-acyltransferase 3 [Morella rubra]